MIEWIPNLFFNSLKMKWTLFANNSNMGQQLFMKEDNLRLANQVLKLSAWRSLHQKELQRSRNQNKFKRNIQRWNKKNRNKSRFHKSRLSQVLWEKNWFRKFKSSKKYQDLMRYLKFLWNRVSQKKVYEPKPWHKMSLQWNLTVKVKLRLIIRIHFRPKTHQTIWKAKRNLKLLREIRTKSWSLHLLECYKAITLSTILISKHHQWRVTNHFQTLTIELQ